jgi:hypothetical protein
LITATVIGIGVIVAILFLFAQSLDRKLHPHLQVFSIIISILLLMFIPKTLMSNENHCEMQVASSTLTGSTTTYTYTQVCYSSKDTTPESLAKYTTLYSRILITYWFLYMFFVIFGKRYIKSVPMLGKYWSIKDGEDSLSK